MCKKNAQEVTKVVSLVKQWSKIYPVHPVSLIATVLAHLSRVDSSTTTLWTGLYPIAGCPVNFIITQGPVVQSAVSLTSSLVVKMLTVLVSTRSNSQVFLLKKM